MPYARKKYEVLANINVEYICRTVDGERCGIYVRSIKSSKPKNGRADITVKMKGSTKEEKKAVKRINRKLKKIMVRIEDPDK